jgi:adenylate cyclase
MTQPAAHSRVALPLIEAAAAGEPPTALVAAFCEALVGIGIPLARASVGSLVLHPLLDATLIVWKRQDGVSVQETPRPLTRGAEAWRRSPFYHLLANDRRDGRYRLEQGEGKGEYPILDEMLRAGITDYLVLRFHLGAAVTLGSDDNLYSSWATDRPGGFSEADIAVLRDLEPVLAFVVASCIAGTTARSCSTPTSAAMRRYGCSAVRSSAVRPSRSRP